MGYKKMRNSLGFADLALASSLKHNRSLTLMNKLNEAINWARVEQILMAHYTVGTSGEGADAYPPLLLFKCMLLQKWFRINSDPELENQINDRLSFKKFLGLSFDRPSPDHSTFSRFRSRLSKNAMDQINSEILRQFEAKGLTINEGIAVDARLVKSASRPISNKEIDELKKKQASPEGKLDKKGKPKKFSRDLDSNWTIKNDIPHYGLKEHAAVDVNHGFVLATTITKASVNDTNYLDYCTVFRKHTQQPIKKNLKKLLALKEEYGSYALIEAIKKASLHNAYGAHYIENILYQEMTPKTNHPPVRLKDDNLNNICLEKPALAEYDAFVVKRRKKP